MRQRRDYPLLRINLLLEAADLHRHFRVKLSASFYQLNGNVTARRCRRPHCILAARLHCPGSRKCGSVPARFHPCRSGNRPASPPVPSSLPWFYVACASPSPLVFLPVLGYAASWLSRRCRHRLHRRRAGRV